MRIITRLALLAGLLVAGAACDEEDIVAPLVIAQIAIGQGDCAGLEVGETCQLDVVVTATDGTVIESPDITWFTEDIVVATVDFQGQVTGVDAGNAVIQAQSRPGPNACQDDGVICGFRTVAVFEPAPSPGPQP